MRKRCRRTVRTPTPPMLVNRGVIEADLEMRERQFVEAFSGGYATEEHFDAIADLCNVMMIAAIHKNDRQAIAMCQAVAIPMANARARYTKTGKMGLSGDELTLLREFVTMYGDFWKRQSVGLYEQACNAVSRNMAELAASKKNLVPD